MIGAAHVVAADSRSVDAERVVGPDEERMLVERARQRDTEAVAALYRQHLPGLYRFVHRRVRDTQAAEDVTSATFERAIRYLGSFDGRAGGFGPWLHGIASRELANHFAAIDRSRSEAAQRALLAHAAATDDGGFAVSGPDEDAAQALAAMGRLIPRYQEALALRFLSGLSPEDAALAMGLSKPHMAVVVHRALSALRRVLAAPTAVPATEQT